MTMRDDMGDKLTCATCGAEGIGIGFAHDCALVFRVLPNSDPSLTCFLCLGSDHLPRELATSFYTSGGRVTVGLHRGCYARARVRIRPLPEPSAVRKAAAVLDALEELLDAPPVDSAAYVLLLEEYVTARIRESAVEGR